MIEELQRIDLLATPFVGNSPECVLLAWREQPRDEQLADHLREAGIAVDTTVLAGLRDVALGWSDRPVPLEAFDAIANWLPPGSLNGARRARMPAVARMRLDVNGTPINEQAVVLDETDPVFGIAAIPREQSERSADTKRGSSLQRTVIHAASGRTASTQSGLVNGLPEVFRRSVST